MTLKKLFVVVASIMTGVVAGWQFWGSRMVVVEA